MSTASRFIPNYTLEDFRHWEGDWQLIEGVPVAMSPSPFGRHERVAMEISTSFKNQLDEQKSNCRVYAGLDWIVSNDTVVRPDVMIVCGEQPEKHLERPPVIAVEILSSSTRELDLIAKRRIYQEHGVTYYLIVDADSNTIEICNFSGKSTETFSATQARKLTFDNYVVDVIAEKLFR